MTYKIEVRGAYAADFEVKTKADALRWVRETKARKDVSLIRVLKGDRSVVWAFEGSGWINAGKLP